MDSRRSLQLSFGFALLLALVALGAGLSRPAPAHGATFVVATTTDAYDVTPGNGVCQGVLGFPCSLRAAVQEANALAGPDVITLPAGTYNLTRSGAGEDSASTGDLDITDDLTINGAGAGTTVIDAQDLDRVFHAISGAVSISGVTIRNGNISDGGGILNSGAMTLNHSTVSGNAGAGISNLGALTLTNSTVSSNTAFGGGGIRNTGAGTLTLTNSTVSGNTAQNGGGIFNNNAMTLTDSTVSSNTAGDGGAIYNHGTLTLTNSTVSGNTAGNLGYPGRGGGIVSAGGGFVTLTDSTVSGNRAVSGNATSLGGGIVSGISSFVTLTNSTVSGNGAAYGGGIISAAYANVTLTNSTVAGNDANAGGGVYNDGTVTLTNSTVSGNVAYTSGAGFFNDYPDVGDPEPHLTITNSTITNNTSDGDANGTGDGGGIASGGAVNIKNTIVAGNFDLSNVNVEPDCYGTLTSHGYNLIQNVSPGCSIGGDAAGNITGQGASLGPLANNGGPTQTHAILAGSPAIDAGSPDCPPPATDQRGVGRSLGNGCDIGAYESPYASCADGDTDSVCDSGDNCPSTPNVGQENADGDAWGNACDNCPAVSTPWMVPAGDGDCDGWTDAAEALIVTSPAVGCGYTSAGDPASETWPADLVESNAINISDVLALKPVFGTSVPPTSARYDIVPSGAINISDVLALKPVLGKSCTP